MLAKNVISKALLLRSAAPLSRAGYHGSGIKATMNDLPVPKGDWYEHHSQMNRKYNMTLALGIAALIGTIAYVNTSGIIHFNYNAPESLK